MQAYNILDDLEKNGIVYLFSMTWFKSDVEPSDEGICDLVGSNLNSLRLFVRKEKDDTFSFVINFDDFVTTYRKFSGIKSIALYFYVNIFIIRDKNNNNNTMSIFFKNEGIDYPESIEFSPGTLSSMEYGGNLGQEKNKYEHQVYVDIKDSGGDVSN